MNYADTLIEHDLQELLGGQTPPDLIEQTLARLTPSDTSENHTGSRAEPAARGRLITPWRLLQAASVLLAIGLMAWLLVRPDALPEGVTASDGASWRVRADHVEISDGWYLLTNGAPELRASGGRVGDVDGRAVAGIGIPDNEKQDSLAEQLALSATEKEMFIDKKHWLTAGSLALCLFAGSAMFNGERVTAQQHEPKPDTKPDPKPDVPSGTGFRVLREWTGADSDVIEPSVEFVTDINRWENLWSQHHNVSNNRRPVPVPAVDFKNEMVLAVFRGNGTNSRGYYVHEILEQGATFTVRIDEHSYQTSGGAEAVTPYGFFVLPATDYAVVVEENVQGLLNKPPLWKKVGFREMTGLPDPSFHWNAGYDFTGVGGPALNEVRVIQNVDEWTAALAALGPVDQAWPSIDFGKYVAIAAFGTRVKGTKGRMGLVTVGVGANRGVLRLVAPVVQTGPNPEFESIYGVWVLTRPNVDFVIEQPTYGLIGEEPKWSEQTTVKRSDRKFGVNFVESELTGGTNTAGFGLARNQQEFTELTKDMSVRKKRDPEWIDWNTENVIVALPGEMRISGVHGTTTVAGAAEHTITYHLRAPSGVDPGIKRPYLLIKVPKTQLPIVLKQSLVSGPAPAQVTEVARLEP